MAIKISSPAIHVLNVVLSVVMAMAGFAAQLSCATQAGNTLWSLPVTGDPILQFTSGGHVLGFSEQGVYLAGLDHALRLEFNGGRRVHPMSESSASEKNGPTKLSKVYYRSVWENIDVIYSAVDGGIAESIYIVYPGGDPSAISLAYNTPVEIMQDGGLHFNFESGYLMEKAPFAWQEINGERLPVAVRFKPQGERQVGFVLGKRDSSHPVYIDPVYQWHTFYGSAGDDPRVGGVPQVTSIALDSSSNIYLAGTSSASWNGPSGQQPLNAFTGLHRPITVIKFNSDGAYQWHTFYGSASQADFAYAITVDSSSNVYVAGLCPATWNGPSGQQPLHIFTGYSNTVILKLNSAGAYQWHTFYGPTTNWFYADAIAVDSSSGLYLAGFSANSWDGPAGQQPLHAFTPSSINITILKLGSDGAYQWHTFFASGHDDYATAIAVDSSSNVYVAGHSSGQWNGPAGQQPLHAFTGVWNMIIIKLTNTGAYQWHTFYGSIDVANAMAVDSSSNIYVAGQSNGPWNGPAGQQPLHGYTGFNDLIVLKLNSAGAYQWHTIYGSAVNDRANGIAVNSKSDVYVAGYSMASWDGPTGQQPLHTYTAKDDITILKLNDAGAYQWHTFYGSTSDDIANAIAVNSSSNIYVAGYSFGAWNGPAGQLPLNAYTGNSDIVVMQMNDGPQPSTDANLGNLVVSQGILTPPFSPGITGYSDTVPNSVASVTVTPTANESHATVSVNGQAVISGQASQLINLDVGDNPVTIEVTAQDGTTTNTYTVTITRQSSNDATLSSLAVSQGTLTPAFSPGVADYTDNVTNSVTSVTVTPTANESHATISVNGQAVSSGQASQSINLSVGDNPITIEVTAQDGTTINTYTVTVTRQSSGPHSGIDIRPATLRTAVAGKPYRQPFIAIGGVAPYTFTENGVLPNGITFGRAMLSGIPKATGSFLITINAKDSKNLTGGRSYTLTVKAPIIIIRPIILRDAVAGRLYKQAFTAYGGAAPYTFTEQGALPNGMKFVKGVLSGVPKVTGSFPITITATDSNNFTSSRSCTLTVKAPVITAWPAILHNTMTGKPYRQVFTAFGGAAPYTFTEKGTLPDGMTFSKGILSGTPTVKGSFPITITATDANNFTGSRNYTLTVLQR